MRATIAALVVSLAAPAWGAPPKVPGPVKCRPGEVIEVEVTEDAAGKVGFHSPYDPADLFVRDAVPRRDKTVSLIVQPKRAEVYRLTVWTAGETAGRTLVIDASSGPAPSPDDGNDDAKPKPNPLAKAVAEAVKKDSATKPQLARYAALFRAAATVTVNDPDLKTGADLLAEMQRAAKNLGLPAGSLDATARAVADHLNKTLAKVATLDAGGRAAAAAAFAEVAAALEAVANG